MRASSFGVDSEEPTQSGVAKKIDDVWSAVEQKSLEAALKSIGKEEDDRWDKVAALVPGRSRKECIRRCKDIAKRVGKGRA